MGHSLSKAPLERERVPILDLWVDSVDMAGAVARAERFLLEGGRPHSIFAVNPEKNFSIPRDRFLLDAFKGADLLIPDGVGVVWAARMLHGLKLRRVTGVALMEELCRLAARTGHSVFVYGAREAVNARAVTLLRGRHPGLRVAGRSNGYIAGDGMERLVASINASKAAILFMALGSPMQERWFATHGPSLAHVRICQGIGGALDVLAGTVKRAPGIWQDLWLEWLYRLLREPSRLARQTSLARFVVQVLKARLQQPAPFRP